MKHSLTPTVASIHATPLREDCGPSRRNFKHRIARACIVLLLMQFVVSAFACPALPQRVRAELAAAAQEEPAVEWRTCSQQHRNPRGLLNSKLRHERYVSIQAIDTRPPGAGTMPEIAPLVATLPAEPVFSERVPVVASLLAHATAPPIPIRFLVLRI